MTETQELDRLPEDATSPFVGVDFTPQEAGLIFQAFEQVPLTGPDTKEVAASIQRKLVPLLSLVQ